MPISERFTPGQSRYVDVVASGVGSSKEHEAYYRRLNEYRSQGASQVLVNMTEAKPMTTWLTAALRSDGREMTRGLAIAEFAEDSTSYKALASCFAAVAVLLNGLPYRIFSSRAEAVAWLDSQP